MSLKTGFCSAVLLLAGLIGWGAEARTETDGTWRFFHDQSNYPVLEFLEGDKVLLKFVVGRTYSIWVAYPGTDAKPETEATVRIVTDQRTWDLQGFLTKGHPFKTENPDAIYWHQWDMGFDRTKVNAATMSDAFGELLGSIADSKKLVLSTDAGDVTLPPVTVPELRSKFSL